MRKLLTFFFSSCLFISASAQDIYDPPANEEIESFLDELSSEHLIDLNSSVRPYSRAFILQKLDEADAAVSKLNTRQKKELKLYLDCYRPAWKRHFTFSGNPISFTFSSPPLLQESGPGGDVQSVAQGKRHRCAPAVSISLVPMIYEQYAMNEYGSINKSEIGAGIFGNIGKHIGFSFGMIRGYQSERLAGPVMFTPEPGQRWNSWSNGAGDYTDWTGQVVVSWKWGSFGIIKDRFTWGDNYHGATIFSDKPPAFPHVRLHVKPAKWIEFNFISGILQSGVIDSNLTLREGDGSDTRYRQKYMSANLVTFIPWKYLDISLGNSVIYGDKFELAYTIPLLFYKSIDHTMSPEPGLTGGTNAQMFLDVSSRQIRHLHLYLTVFIDELKISRITSRNEHNFIGWKGGFRLSDLPVKNLSFTAEGTRTLPFVYQHNVTVTTYETDGFNLGSWMRDNSQEIFLLLEYRPLSRLRLGLSYCYSWHGDNFDYTTETSPTTVPVFHNMTWQNRSWAVCSSWALAGNTSIFLTYENSLKKGDVSFNSPSFQGGTNTVSGGVRVGF